MERSNVVSLQNGSREAKRKNPMPCLVIAETNATMQFDSINADKRVMRTVANYGSLNYHSVNLIFRARKSPQMSFAASGISDPRLPLF